VSLRNQVNANETPAPLELKGTGVSAWMVCALRSPRRLAREERADVGEEFVRADRAVAVVFDETIHHFVDAAQLIRVGRA
jgi:hypothetical protein